jgi:hypothetical protein
MKTFVRFLPLLIAVSASAQSTADAIIARELQSSRAYETLSHITDDIGARLTGSKGAAKAVTWTTQQFREWGIPVTNEPVMVPHWVRGREEARLISPADHNIVLTAIGGSVATPEAGITTDVIEVDSFDELKTLGASKLRGKIVFYNNPMDMELVRTHRAFEAYRIAVAFRGAGPSRAAEYGAKAVVIRSVGSASLRTPHTGALRYDPKQPKIPAAAMTAEDAMLVHRLLARGKRVRMHMVLTPRTLPDVMSANVIAEIRGSEKPEEIVLIGAHLDSWDLATGAIDDGSGVAMVMETMRLLKEMKLTPRRTIRAVLFMNEENGSRGAQQYAKDHGKEKHLDDQRRRAHGTRGAHETTRCGLVESFRSRGRSRRGHRSADAGRRSELRPRSRAAALFRLSPHERRHTRQSRSERARAGHRRNRGACVDSRGLDFPALPSLTSRQECLCHTGSAGIRTPQVRAESMRLMSRTTAQKKAPAEAGAFITNDGTGD